MTSVRSSLPVLFSVSSIVTIEAEYKWAERVYRYKISRPQPLDAADTSSAGRVDINVGAVAWIPLSERMLDGVSNDPGDARITGAVTESETLTNTTKTKSAINMHVKVNKFAQIPSKSKSRSTLDFTAAGSLGLL